MKRKRVQQVPEDIEQFAALALGMETTMWLQRYNLDAEHHAHAAAKLHEAIYGALNAPQPQGEEQANER